MIQWLKNIFNRAMKMLNNVLKEVFNKGVKVLFATLLDVAMQSCKTLMDADLSKEDKQKQAFNDIKTYAKEKGMSVSTNLINILIEICVAYLKKLSV